MISACAHARAREMGTRVLKEKKEKITRVKKVVSLQTSESAMKS